MLSCPIRSLKYQLTIPLGDLDCNCGQTRLNSDWLYVVMGLDDDGSFSLSRSVIVLRTISNRPIGPVCSVFVDNSSRGTPTLTKSGGNWFPALDDVADVFCSLKITIFAGESAVIKRLRRSRSQLIRYDISLHCVVELCICHD